MIRRSLAALAAAALLASCTPDPEVPGVGPVDVDVDTPALRELKASAGVEPCPAVSTAKATGDDALPDVTLPCLGGGDAVDLARLRGPLLVSMWASWCGPCREELPIFGEFHRRYADQVALLGIDSNDVQPQAALELIRDSKATFPLVADLDNEVAVNHWRLRGFPALAFVDTAGQVVHIEPARIKSLAELEQLVEKHLGITLEGATR